MGDLPGSPSVAPSPLFCTALWRGREGAGGLRTLPRFSWIGRQHRRGWKRRRTEVVSTPLYAAPPVAVELMPFSPSSSFSLFLFPPRFVFPFASGERSCSGGPSCGMRHRPEKSQIHRAPCSAAREKIADAGFRFERS
jgi:hypothetical protein